MISFRRCLAASALSGVGASLRRAAERACSSARRFPRFKRSCSCPHRQQLPSVIATWWPFRRLATCGRTSPWRRRSRRLVLYASRLGGCRGGGDLTVVTEHDHSRRGTGHRSERSSHREGAGPRPFRAVSRRRPSRGSLTCTTTPSVRRPARVRKGGRGQPGQPRSTRAIARTKRANIAPPRSAWGHPA